MTETSHAANPALMGLASGLAESAGHSSARALHRLAGGKNNQVYRVETTAGDTLVLKIYFCDPRDPRDRLDAEWNFLRHAWSRGVRAVPRPIACDATAHGGLYSFLPGRKLDVADLTKAHINAAADFVVSVNAAPCDPMELSPASEACFSLTEHMAAVDRRIARLQVIDRDAPTAQDAEQFIAGTLTPAWREVRARLIADVAANGLSIDQALRAQERCVSPSDFGFHNVLADGGHLSFLDFEYAGSDDPAKLVCDFFCQPDVPVPTRYHPDFMARLTHGLGLDDGFHTRCRILLDTYRIKWACIMLNDFLPIGDARRTFASHDDREMRCALQLTRVESYMSSLTTAIHS